MSAWDCLGLGIFGIYSDSVMKNVMQLKVGSGTLVEGTLRVACEDGDIELQFL